MVVKFIVKRSQNRINNWLLQDIFSWLSNRFYLLKDTVCVWLFKKYFLQCAISNNISWTKAGSGNDHDGRTQVRHVPHALRRLPSVGLWQQKGCCPGYCHSGGYGPALPGHRATRFLLQDLLQSFPCPTITGSLTTSFFCWRNWVLAKLDCDLLKVRGLILRTADERQQ